MDLIDRLQTKVAPDIFKPRAVYDGRKNLFAPRALPFGDSDSKEVCSTTHHVFSLVTYDPLQFTFPPISEKSKPLKVRLTKVAEINPE